MSTVSRIVALALLIAVATPAASHHGWLWAEKERFELSGVIKQARLGNPHGLLSVDAKGEMWTVEVGQPWRNTRAGLSDDKLVPGVALTAIGHRASDRSKLLMKAERIVIAGKTYDLYPERS
jgi:hypothetical protein